MANDKIDILVGKQVFEESKRLLADLDAIQRKFLEAYEASQKFSKNPFSVKSTGEAKQKIQEITDSTIKLNSALDQQKAIELAVAEAVKKATAARTGSSNAMTLEEKAARKLSNAKEKSTLLSKSEYQEAIKLEKQNNQNAAALRRLDSFYGQISQKLIKTTQEYKNLSVRQQIKNDLSDKEIRRMQLLEQRMDKYRGALVKADEKSGQYNRNVGNYKSGFDGLGNSINQLSREMPAFAVSANTGFLALSNNIPMLFDEINRLKVANQGLIAQGKPVQSVFSRVVGSLFSFQTALSIGVTLLTLYGGKLFDLAKGFLNFSSATEKAAAAQEKYNESAAGSISNIQAEIVELKALFKVAKNDNESRKKRQQAIDILQSKYPDYLKNLSLENVETNEVADAIERQSKALILKAKLSAAESVLAEAAKEMLEDEVDARRDAEEEVTESIMKQNARRGAIAQRGAQDIGNVADAINKKLKGISTDEFADNAIDIAVNEKMEGKKDEFNELSRIIANIINDTENLFDLFGNPNNNKDPKKNKKDFVDLLKAEFDLKKYYLEREIELSSQVVNDTERNDSDRLTFLELRYKREQELAQLNADEQIRLQDLELKNSNNKVEKAKEVAIQKTLIERQLQDNLYDLERTYSEKRAELTEVVERTPEEELKLRQSISEKLESQEITALNDLLTAKEIATEEHEKRLLEIRQRYAKQRLNTEVQVLEQILAKEDLSVEERAALEAKLAAIKQAISQVNLDNSQKEFNLKEFFASQEYEQALRLKDELVNFTNAIFDNRVQRIDDNIQRNNDYYTNLLDNERLSVEQRAQLEAERDAKNALLEQKKRQEQRKQAVFNKAAAVFEIGINTAQNIVEVAPNPVLIALVSALGAAQLATVAATPIPQYKMGKKKGEGKDGLALVNDGGRDEIKIGADGKITRYSGRNVLDYVRKDDVIIPDANAFEQMQRASIMASISNNGAMLSRAHDVANFDNAAKLISKGLKEEIKSGFKSANIRIVNNIRNTSDTYLKSKMI